VYRRSIYFGRHDTAERLEVIHLHTSSNGASVARRRSMMNSSVIDWRDTQCIVLGYDRPPGPRVLLVDDDPGCREVMALLLTREGFDTDVASNGQDALDIAHLNPPRVIVLDMRMEIMDGWTFLAHQRHDAALGAIPVVILSATPPKDLRAVGAAAAFQKPVRTDVLIAAIRAYC
jgi:CheY-like chemotaxis protein